MVYRFIFIFPFLILTYSYVHAQEYTCKNKAYDLLSTLIGEWKVQTKDRTSPGNYEENTGKCEISAAIEGCGVRFSYRGKFRGKNYAREEVLIGLDSVQVKMVTHDSEHSSFSIYEGAISGQKSIVLHWYRDKKIKRLQSRYEMTIINDNEFEFSSFLSTDYGENWALTHQRRYKR